MKPSTRMTTLGVRLGVVLLLLGAVLLFYAWAEVAGRSNVALQVPYLISAGCSGLGLIALGLTVLNISVKLDHALARERQADELREALADLRAASTKKAKKK